MADVAANEELRFPCKNCGAKLAWTPGAESLTCGHCAYTEAVPKTKAEVVEHAFEDYKPDSTGWDTAMKAWECGQWKAAGRGEPSCRVLKRQRRLVEDGADQGLVVKDAQLAGAFAHRAEAVDLGRSATSRPRRSRTMSTF